MNEQFKINRVIDDLGDIELKLERAKAVAAYLLQDYDILEEETPQKLSIESKRVMNFINITFDYIYDSLKLAKELEDKLKEEKQRELKSV
jgi:hypothetical protein